MKKTLVAIITFCFILLNFQCKNKKQNIPSDIIAPDVLSSIIVELTLIDGAQNVGFTAGNSTLIEPYYFYGKTMEKYGVSKDQLMKSLAYYADHIKLLNEIYDMALKEVSLRREKSGNTTQFQE